MDKPKVLLVVGPTASGKTSLSIKLAQKYNGEVISADSRQVYRGLDLGTGKVTPEEMQGVPHHLLDIADPSDVYTAHDFVRDGSNAIENIIARKKLPIIAGGTFLYMDALMGKISLPHVAPNESLRTKLEALDTNALYAILHAQDPHYAETIDRHNARRLIRAIEIVEALGSMPQRSPESRYTSLTLGIMIDRETLTRHIHDRLFSRLEKGMLDEVKHLIEHGVSYARLETLGIEYKYISHYLQGSINYEMMCEEIELKSLQFAKRQMTWLKRDKSIVWIDPQNQNSIDDIVAHFCNI
jgi:tRNA dimethylallyltransferase